MIDFEVIDDLQTEDGKIKIVRRDDEILQRVRTRLRRILGEWFLNTNTGIPYFGGQILGGKNTNATRLIISSEINSTYGVSEIREINVLLDPRNKKASVYAAILINERIYELTEEV